MNSLGDNWLLVVEDNPDIWYILRLLIPRVLPNISVRHVTGHEGVFNYLTTGSDKGQAILPRAILQDLYMPAREDGLLLLERLKQPTSTYKDIPLVVMSSSVDQQDIDGAKQLGADAYLIKPITIEEWLERLAILRVYYPEES
jgi:CheY-like chemotaxis protein